MGPARKLTNADSVQSAKPVPTTEAHCFSENSPIAGRDPAQPMEELHRKLVEEGFESHILLTKVLREEFQELGRLLKYELREEIAKIAQAAQSTMPAAQHMDEPVRRHDAPERLGDLCALPRDFEEPKGAVTAKNKVHGEAPSSKRKHKEGFKGLFVALPDRGFQKQSSGSTGRLPASSGHSGREQVYDKSNSAAAADNVCHSMPSPGGASPDLATIPIPNGVEEDTGNSCGRRRSDSTSISGSDSDQSTPSDLMAGVLSNFNFTRNFTRNITNLVTHFRSDSSTLVDPTKRTLQYICGVIVEHPAFDFIMAVFVVLNAVSFGVELDLQARAPSDELPHIFVAFEFFFAVVFSLELALRLYIHRWNFYRKPGWGWNSFDTLLVIQQLAELIVVAAVRPTSGADMTSATARLTRFLRVLRMLRVIRIIRIVRFVTELRRVLYLILASMMTFLWALILLAMLIYVLAILLTQAVVDHMREDPELSGSDLTDFFGTPGKSIYNLYKGITGGLEWGTFSTPLETYISPLLAVLVSMYVAFATLVILNLVTGVFVEGAMTLSKDDKRADLTRRLRKVFKSTDSDKCGFIVLEEFERACRSRRMNELFELVGIKRNRARDLFCALDVDDNGGLNIEEFTEGIIDLQNPLKAVHFFVFMVQMKTLLKELMEANFELRDTVEEKFPGRKTAVAGKYDSDLSDVRLLPCPVQTTLSQVE